MNLPTPAVAGTLDKLRELCHRNHVQRLELFGSAATGQFDPAHSDLDFLVEFNELAPASRADAYFDLLASLQDLYGREVDLVEIDAIDNPYFQKTVNAARTVLYAA